MTRRFGIAALLGFALLASWGKPLFSSHFSRQTQTAGTADVFRSEGWNFFYPKLKFLGKPGYTVLEAPFYQSAMYFLNKVTSLSMDQSGRLLSFTFAVLFVWATLLLLRLWELDRRRDQPETGFLWLFSCPLLFAISQWCSIELMNMAAGAWALYFFARSLTEKRVGLWLGLFVTATVSLMLKPVVIFTLIPIFGWLLWRRLKAPHHWAPAALVCLIAGVVAMLWFRHAEFVNQANANPVGIGNNFKWYFFNPGVFNFHTLKTLSGRLLVYVLGPGTLTVILYSLFTDRWGVRQRWARHRELVVILMAGVIFYVLFFLNLNVRHNYYQSPIILPVYLTLLLIFAPSLRNKMGTAVLGLALALNVVVAQVRLAHQDQNWVLMIDDLKKSVAPGDSLSELKVISNGNGAPPALSYYLDRYSREVHFSEVAPPHDEDVIIVCDGFPSASESSRAECMRSAKIHFPKCAHRAMEHGQLWVCKI